jgi:hypothetical protein
MKQQMQMIELSETATGKHHFDVPKGGGHGKQKKDLYTAFMLAARCVYDHLWAEMLPDSIIHHGGVVTSRDAKSQVMSGGMTVGDIPSAIRDKLEIAQDPEGYKKRLLDKSFNGRKVITSSAAVLKPASKGKTPGRTSNKPVNK